VESRRTRESPSIAKDSTQRGSNLNKHRDNTKYEASRVAENEVLGFEDLEQRDEGMIGFEEGATHFLFLLHRQMGKLRISTDSRNANGTGTPGS
jgi:hypothetical protein